MSIAVTSIIMTTLIVVVIIIVIMVIMVIMMGRIARDLDAAVHLRHGIVDVSGAARSAARTTIRAVIGFVIALCVAVPSPRRQVSVSAL